MKRALKSGSLVAAGIVCGALLTPSAAWAADKVQEVFITNTDSQPVPTHQIGTSDVAVTNTPAVVMAEQPVHQRHGFMFQGTTKAGSDTYTVPDDKRLRIDFVSFWDQNHPPAVVDLSMYLQLNGELVTHRLVVVPQADNSEVASSPVALYADPGSVVRFNIKLDSPAGGVGVYHSMLASWSGVLLDI